ncbi:phage tail length tape measure family protein [Sinorhizobium medicae]|uniref:phage tail length tape measure family protein n=1 Tax=Sinorhizobium medicae TaxID=110321 RepID=UPI003C74A1ED
MKDADITVKKTTDAVNDNFNKVGSSADNAARQISRSMRSSAGDVRNLQYQINDIATGLASGQSPFTIMAQQSGQLSQALSGAGGLRGALALVGSAVGGLINPVNLVLAGLAAATLALQAYFDDADSDADAANKALEEHAKLLAEIKERWGATIPEVAEYIGEIERATESLKKQQDLKAIVTDIFKPASEAVAATENSVLDLQSRLSAIGKQDLGGQIARSFAKVKTEVAANRYPLQEMVNLQNLVLQAIALQVTGAKDLADAINRQIVPALRNANTEASEMTRSFGGLPRSLGGACQYRGVGNDAFLRRSAALARWSRTADARSRYRHPSHRDRATRGGDGRRRRRHRLLCRAGHTGGSAARRSEPCGRILGARIRPVHQRHVARSVQEAFRRRSRGHVRRRNSGAARRSRNQPPHDPRLCHRQRRGAGARRRDGQRGIIATGALPRRGRRIEGPESPARHPHRRHSRHGGRHRGKSLCARRRRAA